MNIGQCPIRISQVVVVSNVAASAVAVARSRVARAARAVAVTRAVDFALDDDAVAIVAVVSVNEECEDASNEEEDDVHDAKCPRRLEHRALFIDVKSIGVSRDSDEAQVGAVRAIGLPVRAVCVGNASELIDCADECADEEKVDEGDEVGGMASARIQEERSECPYCS